MATLDTIEGTSLSLSNSLFAFLSVWFHTVVTIFILSFVPFYLFYLSFFISLLLFPFISSSFLAFLLISFVLTLSLSFVYSLSHSMCVVLTQLILLIHHEKTDKNMLIWLKKKGKENVIFMCITLDMIVKLFPNIDRYTFVIAFLVSV
jgi:hypothetical protein